MVADGRVSLAEAYLTNSAADDVISALVHEHARFIYRLAYAILRNPSDAEDVVQETFMRVLKHREDLVTINDTRAWLARIAWRITLNHKRSLTQSLRREEELIDELRSQTLPAEELVLRDEMKQLLARLIDALPSDLRGPLQLSTVDEMSAVEIAAILEIPEASVRTRLFRARKLLREKLTGILGEEV